MTIEKKNDNMNSEKIPNIEMLQKNETKRLTEYLNKKQLIEKEKNSNDSEITIEFLNRLDTQTIKPEQKENVIKYIKIAKKKCLEKINLNNIALLITIEDFFKKNNIEDEKTNFSLIRGHIINEFGSMRNIDFKKHDKEIMLTMFFLKPYNENESKIIESKGDEYLLNNKYDNDNIEKYLKFFSTLGINSKYQEQYETILNNKYDNLNKEIEELLSNKNPDNVFQKTNEICGEIYRYINENKKFLALFEKIKNNFPKIQTKYYEDEDKFSHLIKQGFEEQVKKIPKERLEEIKIRENELLNELGKKIKEKISGIKTQTINQELHLTKDNISYIMRSDGQYSNQENSIFILKKQNGGGFISFMNNDLLEKITSLGFEQIGEQLEKIEKEQKENRETLKKFDLAPNKKTSLIQLLPKTFDGTVTTSIGDSISFSDTLSKRYPQIVETKTLFTDNPHDTLTENINNGYKKGNTNFFIDIYNHGSPEEINFVKGLNAKDLINIINKFPDCTFTINTLACFGGGLSKGIMEEIQKDPSLKQRVSCLLQTKGDFINKVAYSLDPGNKIRGGTPYSLFLKKSLRKGSTLGEAIFDADNACYDLQITNPETIINGVLIGENCIIEQKKLFG